MSGSVMAGGRLLFPLGLLFAGGLLLPDELLFAGGLLLPLALLFAGGLLLPGWLLLPAELLLPVDEFGVRVGAATLPFEFVTAVGELPAPEDGFGGDTGALALFDTGDDPTTPLLHDCTISE